MCGEVCQFHGDKVCHEWATLTQAPCEGSPQKTSKRSKVNKKEVRKHLKLEGKEYITEKRKKIPARQLMQWVECKCRNKRTENVDIDKRKLLHTQYWGIGLGNERRQSILAMTSTKDPAYRTTKHRENSRRKQTPVYFLNKNNNDKVEVCASVFCQHHK